MKRILGKLEERRSRRVLGSTTSCVDFVLVRFCALCNVSCDGTVDKVRLQVMPIALSSTEQFRTDVCDV